MLKLIMRQAKFEVATSIRNSEQQLVSLVFPIGVLLLGRITPLDTSLLSLAIGVTVLGSNLAGPAISLAFDRRYGAIKGWAFTPLGVKGFIAGRLIAQVFLTILQSMVLVVVNFGLGQSFNAQPQTLVAFIFLVLGTSGLAITIASSLRAEAVLAIANLTLVLFSASAIWLLENSLQAINPLSMWLAAWKGSNIALLGLAFYATVFQVTAIRTFKWD